MKIAAAALLLAGTALAGPALAQNAETGDAPPPEPAAVPATDGAGGKQVYTPVDFARYAPRNAADMLQQVPGFSIRDSEQQRGLGQATGNVLFNAQRPSTKSDGLYTLLSRIPAVNVTRIEIVDGASLDIPGLSGQVANVIYTASGLSGQFAWTGRARAHYADPLFTRGSLSLSGRSGALEYEAALDNNQSGRGAAGGPTLIFDGAGAVIETRSDILTSNFDSPKLSGKLTRTAENGNVAHLTGHYQRTYYRFDETGRRAGPGLPDRRRLVRERSGGWNSEIGGDYAFALGPGRFKAIGLRRFNHQPSQQQVVTSFVDGTGNVGDRFTQTGDLGETIARGEYGWKMLGGDWQISGEAAFNTLDNVASLFVLDSAGEFVPVPFPGSSGGVSEDRYESLLSFGRKLSDTVSFQLVAGAEKSTISQTGAQGLSRSFVRPKGSLSLSWTPSGTLDMSLKIRRRVLQLSFYDFLARAFLNDNNQNVGNAELRPQQDWSTELEINRKLGAWGSQQVRLVYRAVDDFVDVIPVSGGESVGNIAKAWAAAIISTSTIKLDPAGLKGVRLDATVVVQTSRVRDPFTGEKRSFSGFNDRQLSAVLRHDIPGSDWAWGAEANYRRNQPRYRSNQVDRSWEGPTFVSLFAENKDVFGLTVRAEIGNLLDARSRRDRTVFTGLRGASPIAFVEQRDRLIGPTFSLSIKGTI